MLIAQNTLDVVGHEKNLYLDVDVNRFKKKENLLKYLIPSDDNLIQIKTN